jgi:SET domain-containing protein
MLLVATYVARSAIHGLGLFAAARIAAGTKMWAFQPGLDAFVPDALYRTLPEFQQSFLQHYGFRAPQWPGGWVVGFDHSRYINHSASPNTDNATEFAFAARDIEPDEEITCDYEVIHPVETWSATVDHSPRLA